MISCQNLQSWVENEDPDLELQKSKSIDWTEIIDLRALCYKIEYLSNLPPEPEGVYLTVSTSSNENIDKLNGMNWYLADKNTWQGVITGHWPYNNIPQKLSGSFKKDSSNYFPIKLREDIWKYLEGQKDFNQCILQEIGVNRI